MSSKYLAIGLIVGLLIGLPLGYFLPQILSSPSQFPLRVSNIQILATQEFYVLRADVSLTNETHTLFNCYVKADYLTENNLWKTTSKNIGTVNYEDSLLPLLFLDLDFKSGNPNLTPDTQFHYEVEPNVKVEAYGYANP